VPIQIRLNFRFIHWLPISSTNLLHDKEKAHSTCDTQISSWSHYQFLRVAKLSFLPRDFNNTIFTLAPLRIFQLTLQCLIPLSNNFVKCKENFTN
jgi:hypothetical protein